MAHTLFKFHIPRYQEIPDIGLYLEQTTKYINGFLLPLGCLEITSSMISNYVKKGYIKSPVKKQYNAEQIASLFFITIVKKVLSMENIEKLFRIQEQAADKQTAYNSFCEEFEMTLSALFDTHIIEPTFIDHGDNGKKILHSTVTAVAHVIYLNQWFDEDKEL